MNVRRFALVFGIIYVVVGFAGFVPALLQQPTGTDPSLTVDTLHGRLLGLFPVNVLHTLVHLAIGIWGLIAAKSVGAAVGYAKGLAIIYALLAIMGLVPGLNTMFGLVPLHSHDVWLHAGTALVAAYFGFMRKHDTRNVQRA
jgi:ABC-type transport system involved in multi-copper enzyme maturation permease subunit